jgi:hypothetical protein
LKLPSDAVVLAAPEIESEFDVTKTFDRPVPAAARPSEPMVAARPRAASAPEMPPTARRARSIPDLTPSAPQVGEPARAHAESARSLPATPRVQEAAAAAVEGLSAEAQDQLYGVLKAALDASIAPLVAKQEELEARLEVLRKAPAVQVSSHVAISRAPEPSKTSIVPTSYGLVIQPEGPLKRPAIEAALENVGPIDMPNFGSGRRAAGRVVVFVLLAGVGGGGGAPPPPF